MTRSAFLVAGARSPIGRFGGTLTPLRATEVASVVAQSLLDRVGVPADKIQRVIAGMVLQDMTESNPARIVGQRIGVPVRAGAFTVNMQCCSGMMALILASQQVALGEVDLVLALGLESMSNAPHMVHGARWGLKNAHAEFVDTFQECTLAGSKMWGDPWYMVDVAEHHAQVDGVSREAMDAYALVSHSRAIDAVDAGRLAEEIVPIKVPRAGREPLLLDVDEHPRRGLRAEDLARLAPVRPGGVITAGNAAGINDGAAAALIASEQGLSALGLTPIARIRTEAMAIVGCDPRLMGYSCVEALNAALQSAALAVDDLDLIECNEGFAVQLVACQRRGRWPIERLNVDGGSIGLGHPVGMSGLRIVIHLAQALRQRDLKRGAATVPAGSGLGTAVVLERV
jgi:acetyl-CoA C-acetyltransferase